MATLNHHRQCFEGLTWNYVNVESVDHQILCGDSKTYGCGQRHVLGGFFCFLVHCDVTFLGNLMLVTLMITGFCLRLPWTSGTLFVTALFSELIFIHNERRKLLTRNINSKYTME
jgi:hypothetical protein